MAKQGLSGQSLEFGKDLVFKYVTDKSKIKNLKSQYNYLERDERIFGLKWIESGGKYGFVMDRLSDDIKLKHIPLMVDYINKNRENTYKQPGEYIPNNLFVSDPMIMPILFQPTYNSYVDYVMNIIYSNISLFDKFYYEYFKSMLIELEDQCTESTSYYHGDFTIHNMLIRVDGILVPIDSNFKEGDMWGSYLLDLSKMFQDVHLINNDMYDEMVLHISLTFPDMDLKLLHLLELTHYIRMLPYAYKKSEILGTEKLYTFLELSNELGLYKN